MTVCESRRPNAGSAKPLTATALPGLTFVPKDYVQEVRTAARTIGFQEQLSAAARRRGEKRRRRVQRCDLRTHGCERIAAAALQLARALQKY